MDLSPRIKVSKDYNKKFKIITSLIITKFPKLKFSCSYNPESGLNEIYFPEKKSSMSIIEPINWKFIKRGINLMMTRELSKEKCNICFEKISKNNIFTTFSKCYQ